jgi:cytochrome c-type biogenesis protein CcmE
MRRRVRRRTGAFAPASLGYSVTVMDPTRKRKIRLTVALGAAVVLAAALIYTSFTGSTPSLQPSRLTATAQPGHTYELTGKVAAGSVHKVGDRMTFRVQDRSGATSVPVTYTGAVPDPFREGREVIVTVRKDGSTFVGQKDSLITKCPSKYKAAGQQS